MATALQNLIDAYIKRNANQEITGPVLNGVLTAISNALGTPFIGSDGYWYTYDAETGQFVKTDTPAQGETGPVGVTSAAATIDDQIGTPEVDVNLNGTQLVFTFRNLKGQKGDTGETGATGPQGETGPVGPIGPQGIQGETGDPGITSVVVTVDSGTGTPSVDASISGTTLTLAFHNLKGETGPQGETGPVGPQGNTGVSADYPITIANNLTTDDPTAALAASQGVVLKGEIDQLGQEVDTLLANIRILYNALGNGAFWGNKPVIDWGGEYVPVIRNLTNCTSDNEDDSVKIGRSYHARITPDSGYVLGEVICLMGGASIPVVDGAIDIDEVAGAITITATGINLDSVAFDGKTYRQIFETNNALGISPGFENGSYSPMTVNAGSPTITTEDADSGTYSLKASGTSSAQIKTGNKSGAAFIACRVKVTSYTKGSCGCQFDLTAGVNRVTDGWESAYQNRTSTSQLVCYVGSFNSANLTGYVDTPVVILKSTFSTVPTFDEFKTLYDQYVAIKKAL